MTSKLAVLLSVLLAVPFIAAPIIIQSGAAPPAGGPYSDDFSTNPFTARWDVTYSWTWNDPAYTIQSIDSRDEVIVYSSALSSVTQCVCADIASITASNNTGDGIVVRANADADSGYSFQVGWWLSSGAFDWYVWSMNGGAWSADNYSQASATEPSTGDRVCVAVSGTGTTGTRFRVWLYGTPSGQACTDTCLIGHGGDGCTVEWSPGDAITSATVADTDSNVYAGLGDQAGGDAVWDNWYAVEDTP